MATIQQIRSVIVVNDNGILTQYTGSGEVQFEFQQGKLQVVVPSESVTACDITSQRQTEIETLRNNNCKEEFLNLIMAADQVLVVDDGQSFIIDGFIYKCRVFWKQHLLYLQQCDGTLDIEQKYNTCLVPVRNYSIYGKQKVCGFAVNVDTMLRPKMKTVTEASALNQAVSDQNTLALADHFEFFVTKSPFS